MKISNFNYVNKFSSFKLDYLLYSLLESEIEPD